MRAIIEMERKRADEGKREARETTGQTQRNKTVSGFCAFSGLVIAISHIFNFTND